MSKYFFFGDSITMGAWDEEGGWVVRLCKNLISRVIHEEFKPNSFYCEPYNLGISGNTIPDVLSRMEQEIKARRGMATREQIRLFFFIGMNDSVFLVNDNQPRFTDQEFEENIKKLIEKSNELSAHITFLGLFPVDEKLVNPIPWAPGKAYRNENIERFNHIIQNACQKYSVNFIPLYEAFLKSGNVPGLLIDGIHPNAAGHAVITKVVEANLKANGMI